MRSTLERTARDAVSAACEDVVPGGEDDLVDGVAPGLVARPASTEQVSALLRTAAEHGLTVTPRGRATKLSWGLRPRSVDLVVDVSAMDRVLDHQAGDLIVETQAGARLSDVQRVVAEGRQRLAVDETMIGATIGGTVATNASGPRRLAAGTARDLLIGITVVRADGVVAKAGGRVVKNVAGYDLGKLVVGSFGTLGVVVEAIFRLHPLAEVQRWVSMPVSTAAEAAEAVHAVVHSQAVPAAVEVEWSAPGDGAVQVLLEGRADAGDGRAATVAELLGAASVTSEEAPTGWAAYPWEQGETALKLTCVLSGLSDVLEVARDAEVRVRGSGGAGVLYGALGSDAVTTTAAVTRLREVCGRHGGTVVVLDGPAEVKRDLGPEGVWGPVPALDLMRRVKDQFDPDHRLSPGRFVGGM